MPNASDAQQIAKAQQLSKQDAQNEVVILRQIMSSPQGRRWMWLELEQARCFEQTMAFGLDGDRITAFQEGKRASGNRILGRLMALAPQQFMQMLSENSTQKEIKDGGSSGGSDSGDGSPDDGDGSAG